MNNILSKITDEYQTIQAVGDSSNTEMYFLSLFNLKDDCIQCVDRESFLCNPSGQQRSALSAMVDLLVINLDAFEITEVTYLLFIALMVRPSVPVVIITDRAVSESVRSSLLSTGALDVIRLEDSERQRTEPV